MLHKASPSSSQSVKDMASHAHHDMATADPSDSPALPAGPNHVMLGVQITLIAIVMVFTVVGNGCIGILLKRFRFLHTVPNILIGNLALIDFLNVTINLPIFLVAAVLGHSALGGRMSSALIFATQTIVILLHLLNMLLMMADRYLAINWALHYGPWKSKNKVLLAVGFVWSAVLTVTIPWAFLLYTINLGDSAYLLYHTAYFHKIGKYNCFVTFPVLGGAIGIIALLTYKSIKRQGKIAFVDGGDDDKSSPNMERARAARQRNENKAAVTVAITIFLYGLCLVPCVMYCSLMANKFILPSTKVEEWLVFFTCLSFYIPGACCPYLYAIRSTRYRKALAKLFPKDHRFAEKLYMPKGNQVTTTDSTVDTKTDSTV
ncbi:trace amine-associated receptor 1 [Nematostella vectensis]|uniref:trace amine-associated receptor 1 n=1 Tax=Nematostella vectensis TaxID=45351 RepID=UPI00207769C5|nr:trace amine-associated receptor 1 [Nematostella vectensis]